MDRRQPAQRIEPRRRLSAGPILERRRQRLATQAFTPAIRVDDAGNLGVAYYDFRNNDGGDAALETDVWFPRSTNGGATWTEQRVTPQSFDMRAAPVARGFFVGDYIGMAAAGTAFTPFWSASDFDADGTDTFSSRAPSSADSETIVPDAAPGGLRARSFPNQSGKPTPR